MNMLKGKPAIRVIQSAVLLGLALAACICAGLVHKHNKKIATGLISTIPKPANWETFYLVDHTTDATAVPAKGNTTNFQHYYQSIHGDSLYEVGLFTRSEFVFPDPEKERVDVLTVNDLFNRQRNDRAAGLKTQQELLLYGFIGLCIAVLAGVLPAVWGSMQNKPWRLAGIPLHLINMLLIGSAFAIIGGAGAIYANGYNKIEYNTTVVAYPTDEGFKKMDTDKARVDFAFWVIGCLITVPLVVASHLSYHHNPEEDAGSVLGAFAKDVFDKDSRIAHDVTGAASSSRPGKSGFTKSA